MWASSGAAGTTLKYLFAVRASFFSVPAWNDSWCHQAWNIIKRSWEGLFYFIFSLHLWRRAECHPHCGDHVCLEASHHFSAHRLHSLADYKERETFPLFIYIPICWFLSECHEEGETQWRIKSGKVSKYSKHLDGLWKIQRKYLSVVLCSV